MDEPTKELVLRLMQEDVKDTLELYKGKRRISQMTDRELALTEWAQELHHYASDLQDCRMARSVARAVLNDGVAIEAAIAEENRDFGDRMIALQLDGLDQSTPAQLLGQANATMAGLTGLMGGPSTVSKDLGPAGFPKVPTSELVENKFPTAESSRHAATRKSESQPHFECVACLEVKPFFDILTAPCSHHYCKACTDRLVRDSFVDESLFPPRCCRMPIPLPTLQAFLTKVSIRRFEEKEMEHNDFNRTYCANPLCSRYILPNPVLLAIRTCPSCNMATCTTCKRQAHTGVCIKEEIEVLELAKREGWQRCARCRNIVELKNGCNHITCRCGFEFCYLCGLKWKICECDVWDEMRLINRAQQVAAQDGGNQRPAQQEVQRAVLQIHEQRGCQHDGRWRRRQGEHLCDLCHDLLPAFILQCQYCRIEVCVRCRYNRL
ncbi:hypothetical protein BDV23DRAFT_196444 [Aspergillus alliaceus]|uniref:RBR-type E3 ubiquitin transferase n=1 Tax=Petromyces alliaceus TaxID=209559 RepID=A0A5N7BX70_PETAA|nr:hypothetical protein BDV23DRAFT_196444 [Aspergillus alliaceus]